jgi:hypothetical protein
VIDNHLRFFRDPDGKHSGGAIARLRLYDQVLTPEQVASLGRLP